MVKLSRILKVAKIISFVFDGSVLVLPVFIAATFYNQKDVLQVLPAFFVSILFTAFIPYSFILYFYRAGRISDIYMPKRRERLIPLLIVNISVIAGFIILMFLQSSVILKTVYMIYLLGLPLISIVTVFYKISFHSSYITMFSVIYLVLFGKWAMPLLLLVPLVGWARITLKRHTLGQVLSGIAATSVVSFSIFGINNFLSTEYDKFNEIRNIVLGTTYLNPGPAGYGPGIIFYLLAIMFIIYISSSSKYKFEQLRSETNLSV